MTLEREIHSQPVILENILSSQWETVKKVASEIKEKNVQNIFLAARGTSDHAGLYAKYLIGAYNRLPIALAAPSLFSIYQQPPELVNSLVLGISQSGQSPDIVSVISEGRRQGVPTLAITNDTSSPLAMESEFVLDICAGKEKAVAATKTYTAQLMLIAMLSIALGNDQSRMEDLHRVPALVKETLKLEETIELAAERYRYMEYCAVLGRGFNYATAFEWGLKLKELAYIVAEPYSSADFQHGPKALVNRGFPIFSVIPDGKVFGGIYQVLEQLVLQQGAELLAISNREKVLELAQTPLRLPDKLPEWLSPIVSIIPAQLVAFNLAKAKGYDTEQPRGLNKITKTH